MKALVLGDATAVDQVLGMSVVGMAADESLIDAYHFTSATVVRQEIERLGVRGALAPVRLKRSLRTADYDLLVWVLDPHTEAVFELDSGLYVGARRLASSAVDKLTRHQGVSKHLFGSAEHFRLWTTALARLSRDEAVPNERPWLIIDLTDAYQTQAEDVSLERYISAINSILHCGAVRVSWSSLGDDAKRIISKGAPTLSSFPRLSETSAEVSVRSTEIESLGHVEARNVRTGHFVEVDGALQFRGVSNGKPSRFVEMDALEGRVVRGFSDEVHATCAALLSHSNGKLYGSVRQPNDASLWELSPGSSSPRVLGVSIGGEQMLRTMAEAPCGSIYLTTFPNAKLIRFDPATENFEDFGRVSDAATYAWGLAVTGQHVWVGTGPTPGLYRIEPRTRSVREFAVPEPWQGRRGFVSEIVVGDDGGVVVGISSDPSDACCWYELKKHSDSWRPFEVGKHIDRDLLIRGASAFGIAENQSAVVECDTQTAQIVNKWSICADRRNGLRSLTSFSPTNEGGMIAMSSDGTLCRFERSGIPPQELAPDFPPSRTVNQSLAADGRGNVFIGTYLSSGVVGVSVGGGHVEAVAGPMQVDSWAFYEGDVLMASYPGVQLYRGRLTSEGKWEEPPSKLFTVGRDQWGLDRPAALVISGGKYYVAAIASYGTTQGALVHGRLRDASEFAVSFPVINQGVSALVQSGEYLVGGTTVHGGLGSRPQAGRAKLFVYDPAIERTIGACYLPWPSTTVVDLIAKDDGSVLGLTDEGILFGFDHTSFRFTWGAVLPYRHRAPWGYHGRLVSISEAGSLYVLVAGEVLYVPSLDEGFCRLLGRGIRDFAPLADSLYFIKRDVLMRAHVGSDHGVF